MFDFKECFIGLEWLCFLFGLYVVVYYILYIYLKEQKFFGFDELISLGFFVISIFFVFFGFFLVYVYVCSGWLCESVCSFWIK